MGPDRRASPWVNRNIAVVLAAKATRSLGYGLTSVAVGIFLAEAGYSSIGLGAVLASGLVGTMLVTLLISFYGDRFGRRRVLTAGSLLMSFALLFPVFAGQPLVLVLTSLTGMIAVSSSAGGGLDNIDQAIVPETVPVSKRTAAFAAYSMVTWIGTGVGAALLGPLSELGGGLGLEGPDRYWPVFATYALMGLIGAALVLFLDRRVELGSRTQPRFGVDESRGVVARLGALTAVDAFAGGLIVRGFFAFWLAERFSFTASEIGTLFALASVTAAASFPVGAAVARRIGMVRTMVLTHIPSSVLLLVLAFLPGTAGGLAAATFLVRSFLSTMDVPIGQSYLMGIVTREERTGASGLMSVTRAGAQTPSPLAATGLLAVFGLAAPLALAAGLQIVGDLTLYRWFADRPAEGEEPLRE